MLVENQQIKRKIHSGELLNLVNLKIVEKHLSKMLRYLIIINYLVTLKFIIKKA